MTTAHLKGLSEDGTHLLLVAEDGSELRLEISDDLRTMVRSARVTRAAEPTHTTSLTPREIQQRIRGGLNAAELAHLTGEPVEALAKFEAPVLAERAYIVQLAQSVRIGADSTAPSLIDLVGDRLASRGVTPDEVTWDAWREVDEPWKVAADYTVAGRTIRALWTFDHSSRTLTAEDEESGWLTETELLEAPIPRRHLSAVRADVEPLEAHRPAPVAPARATASDGDDQPEVPGPAVDPTEELLDGLAAKRGTRESIDMDDDDVDDEDERFEGFGPAARRASQPPAKSPSTPAAPQPRAQTPTPPTQGSRDASPSKARKGRASVPSWDEIVFGAKND